MVIFTHKGTNEKIFPELMIFLLFGYVRHTLQLNNVVERQGLHYFIQMLKTNSCRLYHLMLDLLT